LSAHEVAIDQHRELGSRLMFQKFGSACFASEQIHADRFEGAAEFLYRATGADRGVENSSSCTAISFRGK
jgi:hypothetical protein